LVDVTSFTTNILPKICYIFFEGNKYCENVDVWQKTTDYDGSLTVIALLLQ